MNRLCANRLLYTFGDRTNGELEVWNHRHCEYIYIGSEDHILVIAITCFFDGLQNLSQLASINYDLLSKGWKDEPQPNSRHK